MGIVFLLVGVSILAYGGFWLLGIPAFVIDLEKQILWAYPFGSMASYEQSTHIDIEKKM